SSIAESGVGKAGVAHIGPGGQPTNAGGDFAGLKGSFASSDVVASGGELESDSGMGLGAALAQTSSAHLPDGGAGPVSDLGAALDSSASQGTAGITQRAQQNGASRGADSDHASQCGHGDGARKKRSKR